MKLVLLALAVTLAAPLVAAPTAEPPAAAIPALSPDQLTAALGAGTWLIVEFGGEHCIPCKAMQPVLQELRDTLGDKVVIRNFWIQEHPDVARTHKIMVMPTQIVFDPKGTEVLRHQGVYPLAEFRAALAGKGLS
jgi:thioredoxin 1